VAPNGNAPLPFQGGSRRRLSNHTGYLEPENNAGLFPLVFLTEWDRKNFFIRQRIFPLAHSHTYPYIPSHTIIGGGDMQGFIDVRNEMVRHIRGRIKHMGIRARVRQVPGSKFGIQVFTTGPRIEFTESEQRAIRELAVINGLTAIRGLPIDIERMTDPFGMNFYITEKHIQNGQRLLDKYPSIYSKSAAA